MEHVLALQALEVDTVDALAVDYQVSTYGWSTLSVACCGWSHYTWSIETQ